MPDAARRTFPLVRGPREPLMAYNEVPRLIITERDENGIASITSIESRHDAKGALYAQACARARGDVIRFVTRFPSHRVTASRLTRKRVLVAGGVGGWLGLLPLGMFTAHQLSVLTGAVVAAVAAAAVLVVAFPLRCLAVLATAVMLPFHLLTGHTCPGAHCPGCAG